MPPARLRASDQDRERVLAVLRAAVEDGRIDLDEFAERSDQVHAARFLGDLPPVTADLLPADRQPIQLTFAPVLALLRTEARSGRWVVPRRQAAFALLGTARIDLTDALLVRDRVRLDASALLGRVEIRVPDGVEVRMRGRSFLGVRFTSTRPSRVPDAPVLEVEGFSIFGSVRVSSPRRRLPWPRRGRGRREVGER
ncbi:hypothetical protein DEF23_03105 [Marinitenerispora sediminis]|uniref:DUF1707 domain-containing protein n=1 Tax=Marinitenerispora sediminis TaxID=1931232 RepID=A0A368TBJ1_9ACTN|nr:hypothetical protein DEF28_08280 [Marinitenerispora sediminis]RCV61150.1 hypothetical protein DEF23_03105 [Marinitenerispora sediminis]RCV62425.1 hypothetical protein DEF24_01365 [Marinitenerispora sediminis]